MQENRWKERRIDHQTTDRLQNHTSFDNFQYQIIGIVQTVKHQRDMQDERRLEKVNLSLQIKANGCQLYI